MKGRRFSFAFTGRERYLLKASSNSSRRPVRLRTWRHEFWFANEISTLPRISHSAIFSRAAFVFDSFHDELQLYGLFSQSDSFRAPLFFFPFIPIPFFPDLIALLSLSCRCHRSTLPFVPLAGNFRGECRTEEELAAWNSRTDWILIIPAFLLRVFHVLRLFLPSSFSLARIVLRYVRHRILQKRRIRGKRRK